jgi:hypothetical protein
MAPPEAIHSCRIYPTSRRSSRAIWPWLAHSVIVVVEKRNGMLTTPRRVVEVYHALRSHNLAAAVPANPCPEVDRPQLINPAEADTVGKAITRQALYDAVWAQPIMELAKDFGVSDVAWPRRAGSSKCRCRRAAGGRGRRPVGR